MKIIVSSKALAKKLSEIDFNNNSVISVGIKRGYGKFTLGELSINTVKYSVKINVDVITDNLNVDVITDKDYIMQEHRRWDWVRDLLNKVDEQPIVLEISQYFINVIFQY